MLYVKRKRKQKTPYFMLYQILAFVLGVVTLHVVWFYKRNRRIGRSNIPALWFVTVVVLAMMYIVIKHPSSWVICIFSIFSDLLVHILDLYRKKAKIYRHKPIEEEKDEQEHEEKDEQKHEKKHSTPIKDDGKRQTRRAGAVALYLVTFAIGIILLSQDESTWSIILSGMVALASGGAIIYVGRNASFK